MRQAAVRLKNKIGDKHHRESNRLRQQKCHMLKVVPQSPSKYHKVFKSLCKAASSSPRKKLILQNCLSSFKFESIPTPKPKLSILQLQMLRRQNRLFEHKQLVTKIKREYGSINKASLQLYVPYKTLHSLCKPLEKKRKTVRETWVNIRLFRWFKFTLKPPYSGAHEHSLLAIWDTSHWNFFVKFGLRTA